jgi:hypothetical protein
MNVFNQLPSISGMTHHQPGKSAWNFYVVWVCDLKENKVLEVDGNTGACGRESESIGFAGGSRCDAADRDEEVSGWGDIVSELANDEGVALFISGFCCDVEHEGEMRYLAHTIHWPATRD